MRVMSEEKLQKLAEFIKQYARDNNGESPSLADIMEYMGMVKSTAYRHILELEKRGVISLAEENARDVPPHSRGWNDRVRHARRAGGAYFKIPCRSGGVARR